jgi:very-short-patch-repair endonuclease
MIFSAETTYTLIFLAGSILLAAIYRWFFGHRADDASPTGEATDRERILAAGGQTGPTHNPPFEQAYQRKLAAIKRRRQQREQTRRLAAERTRQAVQLRIQPGGRPSRAVELEQTPAMITLQPPTSGDRSMTQIITDKAAQPESDYRLRQQQTLPAYAVTEKSINLLERTALQRKVQDPRYSLGWQRARQVAAETVSPNDFAGNSPLPLGAAAAAAAADGGIHPALPASAIPLSTTEAASAAISSMSATTDRAPPPQFSLVQFSAVHSELLNDYAGYFMLCDSNPQRILLKALIQRAKLKPSGDSLNGAIKVKPQSKVLSNRVDFLINDKLAVDIDRHIYRNSKMTTIRDRMRDQSLVLDGYRPMTFSGSQILADPDGIAQTIIAAASQLK